jgi:hypothetical protein
LARTCRADAGVISRFSLGGEPGGRHREHRRGGFNGSSGRAGASRPAVLTPAVQWGSCPATIPAQFRCATEPVPLNYQHPAGQRPGDGAAFPVDVRQGVDRAGQEVFLDRFLPLCAEAGSACAFSSGGNRRAKWRTLLARAQAGQLS